MIAEDWSVQQGLSLIVAALAFYRAAVFIHEIAHRPAGTFRAFTFMWNVLCGIPLFMPSFLYGDHKSHHSNQSYGTSSDAEYLLGGGPGRSLAFLLLAFVYPVIGWLRFLLLTPVVLVLRRLDRPVWTYMSSLYMMNPEYRREYDGSARSLGRWAQEVSACAWAWCVVVSLWTGYVPSGFAVKAYVLFLCWMGLNQIRTLLAHRYRSDGAGQWTYTDQILDSNTFDRGGVIPELWAPLGLRYHALHHLMPRLPYHSMGEAHRRLMRRLPANSPYRHTLQPGFWHALRRTLTLNPAASSTQS
jgi:fatty acid desaturase